MRTPVYILVCLVIAGVSRPSLGQSVESSTKAAVIPVQGEINDYVRDSLERKFGQARAAGATTIILDIDTYGGLVTSALEISHFIKRQDDLTVIAYVNNKAISAGAMIALACDEIVMAPVSTLGDCAPIRSDGEAMAPTERGKSESIILAEFDDSARRNGYDPLLARAMVTLDPVVHLVEKDGQKEIVGAERYKELLAQGWKPATGVPDPVDTAQSLLTVSAEPAVKLGLAKSIAGSRAELVSSRGLEVVAVYEPGFGEEAIGFLHQSWMRALLLTAFMICLYSALHAPGHGFPEVLSVIMLALLVGVPLMTGYAQWWEIIAILVGIGLLAVEIFVLPGFGIAGISGLVLVALGFLMTFVAPEPGRSPVGWPSLPISWIGLQRGLLVLVIGMSASIFLCWWLSKFLPRLPMANRLILTANVGETSGAMVGSLTNIDPMSPLVGVGSHGTALTDLLPGGSAKFIDPAGSPHVISVVSDSGFIARGSALRVHEVAGTRVVVRQDSTETAA